MLKRRIACILIILAAFILYFFDNDSVTLALLLALIIMPAASLALLAATGRNLSVSMSDADAVTDKPAMKLTIENPGIVPIALAEFEINSRNLRTGETDRAAIHTSPAPKSKKETDFEVHSGHAGRYAVYVPGATIWDSLMLKSREISCDDSIYLTVMPEIFDMHIGYASDAALLESDRSADSRQGDDPGDVRGIREYVAGDPVRNMHWKLSEKVDKMLVKELGTPISDQFLVVLGSAAERSSDPEALDAIASVFASLLETLRLDGVSLSVAWTDSVSGRPVIRKVHTEEEFAAAADEYLATPASMQSAFAGINRNIADARYAHVVIVGAGIPAGIEAIANGCTVTVLMHGSEGNTTENNVHVVGFGTKTYREDLAGIVI